MQIAVWSNESRSGTTLCSCVLATLLAARQGYKTFITHSLMNNTKMEKYLLKSSERQAILQIGDTGIEALLRTCRNGKLSPDILHNFSQSLLSHSNLDLLDSQVIYDESEEVNKSFLYYLKIAKRYYDVTVVDLNSKLSKSLMDSVLHESDVLLIVTTVDHFDLEDLRNRKREIEDKHKNLRVVVLINGYDERSSISKSKLLLGFEKKNTFLIPYQIELQDSCNRSDLLDFMLRQLYSKRRDSMSKYIRQYEEMIKEILVSYQQEERTETQHA